MKIYNIAAMIACFVEHGFNVDDGPVQIVIGQCGNNLSVRQEYMNLHIERNPFLNASDIAKICNIFKAYWALEKI